MEVPEPEGNHKRRRNYYSGVEQRPSGNWTAEIRVPHNVSRVWLGTFESAEAAATGKKYVSHYSKGNEAEGAAIPPEHANHEAEADPQYVSHSSTENKTRKTYRGVREDSSGSWHAQIHDPVKRATVGLGTFRTAEAAAMAFDEAALKLRGCKARLNFPNREAGAHISYAQSVDLLFSGKDSPFKRKHDSQSSPGSVSNILSREGGQNHQSFLEEPQKEHQIVRNPVSLQEQTKGVLEPCSVSQFVDAYPSGMDGGIVAQPDSSSQPSGVAFDQTPNEDYVLSSSWGDLSELDNYLERDKAISSMIAALYETIQRTFSDKTTPSDIDKAECSEQKGMRLTMAD